jgi:hypothetical protein
MPDPHIAAHRVRLPLEVEPDDRGHMREDGASDRGVLVVVGGCKSLTVDVEVEPLPRGAPAHRHPGNLRDHLLDLAQLGIGELPVVGLRVALDGVEIEPPPLRPPLLPVPSGHPDSVRVRGEIVRHRGVDELRFGVRLPRDPDRLPDLPLRSLEAVPLPTQVCTLHLRPAVRRDVHLNLHPGVVAIGQIRMGRGMQEVGNRLGL